MTLSTTATLESLKLQLVEPRLAKRHASTPNRDLVRHLIRALEAAEPSLVEDIENTLTRVGPSVTGDMLWGLKHDALRVRSTCAMVLIRLGKPVIPAVQVAYANADADQRWVLEFILDELGAARNASNVRTLAAAPRHLVAVS